MPSGTFRKLLVIGMMGFLHPLMAHVALDYPQGGETFIEGQTITLEWHIVAVHMTLNWDLYFSSNGGNTWEPIQLNVPLDSLTYTWNVPSIYTSQARVRVIQDNEGQDYYGTSMDFTIVPNTSPPSLDAPAVDTIIECNSVNQEMAIQAWLNNHGGADATNHCGALTWVHDYAGLSNGCGISGNALVGFTASDNCGSTFTIATVTIVDTSPPIVDVPPMNLVTECDGNGNTIQLNQWLTNHGGAHASDACSSVVWTHDDPIFNNGCGASGSAVITFRVTDECGNSTSAVASFSIADSTSPEMSSPAHDTIIECEVSNEQTIQHWLDLHGGAHANDLCGNIHWTHNYSTLNITCGSAGNATVVFTATDDCGNSKTTIATITVADHLSPTITIGAQDTTIQCSDSLQQDIIQRWLDQHGGAQASDACSQVNWTNDYTLHGDSCIAGATMVTFTAVDDCGNSATTQAWLTILDTTTQVMDTTVFAPLGATWYYTGATTGPPWIANRLYCLFVSEKDTFMLGYHARVIGCYYNDDGQLVRLDSLTKYVATIGQQVYYKVADAFVLLYDFGAAAGDTIHSMVEDFELSLGCSSPDSVIDFSYVIDSVKVVQIDGEDLIAQYVTSQYHFPGPNWGFWDFIPIYERLGNVGWGGFWWGVGGDGCILEGGYLRCYEDDKISWRDSQFNNNLPCDYLDASRVEHAEVISLYPNPTDGIIYLPEGADAISVFSFDGRKVDFNQHQNEIDLSGSDSGLYIVNFGIGEQRYFSKIVLSP